MICSCGGKQIKHGKTRSGYQRWKCTACKKTVSDSGLKAGRPCLYDRPLTNAEKMKRVRQKKKLE